MGVAAIFDGGDDASVGRPHGRLANHEWHPCAIDRLGQPVRRSDLARMQQAQMAVLRVPTWVVEAADHNMAAIAGDEGIGVAPRAVGHQLVGGFALGCGGCDIGDGDIGGKIGAAAIEAKRNVLAVGEPCWRRALVRAGRDIARVS